MIDGRSWGALALIRAVAALAVAASLAGLPAVAAERPGSGAPEQPLIATAHTRERGAAAEVAGAGPAATLLERAARRGRLRVIVGLDHATPGERAAGPAPPAAAARAAREGLARAQAALVRRLGPGLEAASASAFAELPFVTLEAGPATLRRLLADPGVASVQEDALLPPVLNLSVPRVRAPAAWELGFTGRGHTVAILDTGVDPLHPMLTGKLRGETCYSTTQRGVSASFCPGGAPSAFGQGTARNCAATVAGCEHGTFVAGIAAGNAPGQSGVARDARLVAYQVFSRVHDRRFCRDGRVPCVGAYVSDVVRALEHVYAARTRLRLAAVNLSLGGGRFASTCDRVSPAMTAAVGRLRGAGVATVAAAGNDGLVGAVAFPACLSTVVAVGATGTFDPHVDGNDSIASFSNFGWQVDVMAPGFDVRSAAPGGTYVWASGTSVAAPHVAGGFAVLRQASPTATVDEIVAAMGQGSVRLRHHRAPTYSRVLLDLSAALEALGMAVAAGR